MPLESIAWRNLMAKWWIAREWVPEHQGYDLAIESRVDLEDWELAEIRAFMIMQYPYLAGMSLDFMKEEAQKRNGGPQDA